VSTRPAVAAPPAPRRGPALRTGTGTGAGTGARRPAPAAAPAGTAVVETGQDATPVAAPPCPAPRRAPDTAGWTAAIPRSGTGVPPADRHRLSAGATGAARS